MSWVSATLTNAVFAYLCICVFVFVYLQVRHPGTLFLRSLYHHLSENIWFVWSKTSYSGDKRRCYQAGQTNKQMTMEDRATQPLGCWKAEFRNIFCHFLAKPSVDPRESPYNLPGAADNSGCINSLIPTVKWNPPMQCFFINGEVDVRAFGLSLSCYGF